MSITMKDGRTLSGTELQILQQMQSLAFGADGYTVAQYVDFVIDHTKRFENVELKVTGSTDEELAASVIAELLRAELVFAS